MRWFRPRALPRLLALAATLLLLYPTPCRGWERDVLVVLTWHSASIDWLRVLPASVVRVALFAKPGGIASCEAVPVRVKRLVASCTEVHNYGGREAHTMAAFMEAFYDDLPRVVVFAQDDCPAFPRGELFHPRSTVLGRTVECGVLRLAAWSLPEVDAWLARVEAAPGAWATKDNCLCTLVDEPFRQCEEGVPSEHLPCAGAGFYAMQYFANTLMGVDLASHGRILWTEHAHFAVSRAAIRTRPRLLYTVLREVLSTHDVAGDGAFDETRVRERDGASCVGGNTRRHSNTSHALLMVYTPPPVDKTWSSLHWAHTMERLWMAALDPDYAARALARRAAAAGGTAAKPAP